jgi:hypothetical protein
LTSHKTPNPVPVNNTVVHILPLADQFFRRDKSRIEAALKKPKMRRGRRMLLWPELDDIVLLGLLRMKRKRKISLTSASEIATRINSTGLLILFPILAIATGMRDVGEYAGLVFSLSTSRSASLMFRLEGDKADACGSGPVEMRVNPSSGSMSVVDLGRRRSLPRDMLKHDTSRFLLE